MTFFSSSDFKILIIVLDFQNAQNVPGTTSPSSSILAPAGENFRMQLSRVKNLERKLDWYMSNKFLSIVLRMLMSYKLTPMRRGMTL